MDCINNPVPSKALFLAPPVRLLQFGSSSEYRPANTFALRRLFFLYLLIFFLPVFLPITYLLYFLFVNNR